MNLEHVFRWTGCRILWRAATFLLLTAAACSANAEPVRIGFSKPLTGRFSEAAKPQFDAYELWRDRINAEGGMDVGGKQHRPIVFVWQDDQSNPAIAAEIYEELIVDEKVDLLLAPWGTVHLLAVSGVVERHKFPLLANIVRTAAFDRLELNHLWFPSPLTPQRVAAAVTAFLKSRDVKSVALVNNDLPFCDESRRFLSASLNAASLAITNNIVFPAHTPDFMEIASSMREVRPDVIILNGLQGDTALFLKAAEAANLSPILIALSPPPTSAVVSGTLQLFVPSASLHQHSGRMSSFAAAYLKKYGKPSDLHTAPQAYASVEILQQAVSRSTLSPKDLNQTLGAKEFETVIGRLRFGDRFNSVTPLTMLKLQNAGFETIWAEETAAGWTRGPKPE